MKWQGVALAPVLLFGASEAWAVSHGFEGHELPAVVRIGAHCTGTLVAPQWVLTANHCTQGIEVAECVPDGFSHPDQGAFMNNQLHVFIPPPGSSTFLDAATPMSEFDGTHERSYRVVARENYWSEDPMLLCEEEATMNDLALLRLDRPVPLHVARPVRTPVTGGICPEDLDDTRFFGFGPGRMPQDPLAGPEELVQVLRWQDGSWSRDPADTTEAGYYERDWHLYAITDPLNVIAQALAFWTLVFYDGMVPGDSGGPLFFSLDEDFENPDAMTVCGVNSASAFVERWGYNAMCIPAGAPVFWPYCPLAMIVNRHAATNGSYVAGWMEWHIKNFQTGQAHCMSGPDTDEDGVLDECDQCPTLPNPGQSDLDCDGVINTLDECPFGDDALDDDEDGCPDQCDKCPGEGNVPGHLEDVSCGDIDLDGWCNSHDSCPWIANPWQDNANSLAEWARLAAEVGDACEPVPQPMLFEDPYPEILEGGACDVIMNHHVTIYPAPSRSIGEWSPGWSVPVDDVPTAFRFCQPAPGIDCLAYENIWDALLDVPLVEETAETAWHRMSFEDIQYGTIGANRSFDYDGTPWDINWNHTLDAERWLADHLMDLPVVPAVSPSTQGSALDGYLWAHAYTNVGTVYTDVATGVHPYFGIGLANTYMSLAPEYEDCGDLEDIFATLPWWQDYFLPPGDPAPFLDFVDDGMLHVGTDGVAVVAVDSRRSHDLVGSLGPALHTSFAMGWTWVGSVDRPIGDEPIGLAMDVRGTEIKEAIFLDDRGKLIGLLDEGAPVGRYLPQGEVPAADTDAQAVYSPRLASVIRWSAGAGTIARYDLRAQRWTSLASGLDLVTVSVDAGNAMVVATLNSPRGPYTTTFSAYTGLR